MVRSIEHVRLTHMPDAYRSQKVDNWSRESVHRRWAHRRYVAEVNREVKTEDDSVKKGAIEATDCTAIMEALMQEGSYSQIGERSKESR